MGQLNSPQLYLVIKINVVRPLLALNQLAFLLTLFLCKFQQGVTAHNIISTVFYCGCNGSSIIIFSSFSVDINTMMLTEWFKLVNFNWFSNVIKDRPRSTRFPLTISELGGGHCVLPPPWGAVATWLWRLTSPLRGGGAEVNIWRHYLQARAAWGV